MDAVTAALRGEAADWDDPGPDVARLVGVPQTVRHHAEGDVATHTRLTLDLAAELADDLPDDLGALLRVAALLHDVGKPETTVDAGDGRYPARGHETVGAGTVTVLGQAHAALRERSAGFRAAAATLVRHHMWTYHPDDLTPGQLLLASHQADPSVQRLLWEADTRGRVCDDPAALADQVAYAGELLREHDADRPGSFGPLDAAVDVTGLDPYVVQHVFRDVVTGALTDPWAAGAAALAAEKERRPGSLTYTVGLPGLGKSTWSRAWAERTGGGLLTIPGGLRRRDRRLAAIRNDERIPVLLAAGADVCVDATHLSRRSRDRLVGYAGRYRVPVHAVFFDGALPLSLRRQRTRPGVDAVPASGVQEMAAELRLPTPDEYATLTVVDPATGRSTTRTAQGAPLDEAAVGGGTR